MLDREYFARDGQRYVRVSPGSVYESQVQSLVARNVGALFPEYAGAKIDPLIRTPAGDVQPDLVLVRRDGRGWALVEVEVEGHSFRSHILPQLTKMIFAESSPKIAELLVGQLPELPPELIRAGLAFRPAVFLVMHGSSEREEARLTKLGVEVRDVDVLKAPDKPNDYALVVADRTIRRRALHIEATRDTSPMTRHIWRVRDLTIAGLMTAENKIAVEIAGTWAFWKAMIQADEVLLLQPSGISTRDLDVDSIVRAEVLVDDEHSVLYLEPTGGTT